MKIDKITFEMGRDFYAVMRCEHCDSTQENKAGYHDAYYHNEVIPSMVCETCGRTGRNRDGTLTHTTPTSERASDE